MKIASDYHIHSIYSGEGGHAEGSIRDLVRAARDKGLVEILITDHGPGHYAYGLDLGKIQQIRKEVDQVNGDFDDIQVYLGVEANIIGSRGQIDIPDEYLKCFDKVSVGYHYGVIPKDLKFFFSFFLINQLARLVTGLRGLATRLNTQAMIRVVEVNDIFTITHPGSKAPMDIYQLALACEREGTALEINSSGHARLDTKDIKEAMKTGVMFTLGSDAHKPERVGDLKEALKRVKECGVGRERIINKFIGG